LQTVRSAASASLRRLALTASPSARIGSFSQRTLSIAKKILFRCGRLDIVQGGRRTSGRCHCISATPRPVRGPARRSSGGVAGRVLTFRGRALGLRGAQPTFPGRFSRGIRRSQSGATCSRARRARCCAKSGQTLRRDTARRVWCGRRRTTARRLPATKCRDFGAERSDDRK
jgi:hypothetical protein